MLLKETGKPLIQHTYETALTSREASKVVVATDSLEILDSVRQFGGEGYLTSPDHLSGTDRVAEVAAKFPDFEVIVNLQGDEPELPAEAIDLAVTLLKEKRDAVATTLAAPIVTQEKLVSPDCVKVVLDHNRRAMYFSRSAIPFPREGFERGWQSSSNYFLQHIGLYVYRNSFLQQFSKLPPSNAEKIESLEQLRVLQAGFPIYVAVLPATQQFPKGIDTAEDYAAFVNRQRTG